MLLTIYLLAYSIYVIIIYFPARSQVSREQERESKTNRNKMYSLLLPIHLIIENA